MSNPITDYARRYQEHAAQITPEAAVGGHFEEFGAVMRDILIEAGLRENSYLIDAGCGSGRLAHTLTLKRYLGTDVVPQLLQHARSICPDPAWRFEVVDHIVIPEQDGAADMVCFFSVFTHLLHEDSFRYLREARRVLRPGGKVVFSFLEFRAEHWHIFEGMVRDFDEKCERPHTQFLDRDAVRMFARYAGFAVERFDDEAGQRLGQSVCILA